MILYGELINVVDNQLDIDRGKLGWRDMGNTPKTPIIAYITELAAMRTGMPVRYEDRPVCISDMDWCDAAEAWENGYSPDPSMGSWWVKVGEYDLGEFWNILHEYEVSPPIRQINQLKAIDHLEDKILHYEESVFDEVSRDYYNTIIIPKLKFLRDVKKRTRSNLEKGI